MQWDASGFKERLERLLAPREDGKRFSYQAFKRAFVAAGRDLNAKGQTPHAIRAGRAVWDLVDL